MSARSQSPSPDSVHLKRTGPHWELGSILVSVVEMSRQMESSRVFDQLCLRSVVPLGLHPWFFPDFVNN